MPEPGVATPPAIAIRRAVEEGWGAFSRAPVPFVAFTLVTGAINLVGQLTIQAQQEQLLTPFGQPDRRAELTLILAWIGWGLSNLWLALGLLQGAHQALGHHRPRLRRMLRPDGRAMLRGGGTLALVLLVLSLIARLAQASAWLIALIQPALAWLPLLAGWAVGIYLVTDQLLCLPISVLGPAAPLRAFRLGRQAIDPHWLQALGLTLVLGLVVLAGFLFLLIGLAITLPVATCIQVAAYRQLFPGPPDPEAPA
ncbi:hypothetical protein [Cyanobium sp. NIES-981]|uniref:hypothetical protein n=1 Tax=Cyanobium sp. NIES-981 TaxID=1851505 RepID=UPI0007DCD27D|nr:hypothetical protein [Cyanobium sp. NIES-981]SBO44505.1 conserved membrane protein of unknown function [Cyanobium sp. NIES-981]